MACGTVRSYRKGCPRDIADAQTEEIKCLKREESVYRQNGTTTCVGWKDRKLVCLLATSPVSPTSNSEVERSVKTNHRRQLSHNHVLTSLMKGLLHIQSPHERIC